MDSTNSFNDVVNSETEYFKYADADVYQNEIAELYSYTEYSEFRQNFRAYVIEIDQLKCTNKWLCLEAEAQRSFIMSMIDRLEVSDHIRRMLAARCILYLAQGCWMEVKTAEGQQECARANVLLLYRLGAFLAFINLLNMELERSSLAEEPDIDSEEAHITMHDSMALRLIMNVLYILIETIRYEKQKGNPDFANIAIDLISELSNPMPDGEMFQIKLLNMVVKYCSGSRPHFPIKKVMLLLWKSTLLGLGGFEILKQQKAEFRLKAGLPPFENDTLNVAKCMQATILVDEDAHVSRKMPIMVKRIKTALFESNDETSNYLKKQMAALVSNNKLGQRDNKLKDSSTVPIDLAILPKCFSRSAINSITPKSNSSTLSYSYKDGGSALLFKPKVRNSDIEKFLQNARQKYIGYSLSGDHKTLIGLPKPIHESVQALRRHLYVSLSEVQITAEEQGSKKFSSSNRLSDISPAERLYEAMLPNISDYVQDLLRLHQAASPTAKLTAGNVNSRIITDMLPKNLSQTAISSSTMKSDVLRHKEIIIKASSAFLLLCLKHFKLNHIYHSEYMCQLLFQSNFIKQVLRFFTPSISEYVQSTTNIPAQDFPACVIAEEHDHCPVSADAASDFFRPPYSWRNLFACINLLRLLNKVVKWKPSRIVNMVFLKSVNMLKESLKVQQPLLQLYALKLLKMQAKFLGRNWRRHNLKVLTAIYTKVRPRFNDDWAYGCKTVGDFWGAQEDEMEALSHVKDYHLRRFPHFELKGFCANADQDCIDFQSSATDLKAQKSECFSGTGISHLIQDEEKSLTKASDSLNKPKFDKNKSVSMTLMEPIEHLEFLNDENEDLSEDFKENYEVWLDNQVFNSNFDWDSI